MSDPQPAPPAGDAFSHLDARGQARMVDVGGKATTVRRARACGWITMQPATLVALTGGAVPKGDVLAVARIAGIQAAKDTARWIPLCHPLPLDAVEIELTPDGPLRVRACATVRTTGRTGVEMEALTAVSAALLTIYDMLKGMDRAMTLGPIQLEEKDGGRSGRWVRAGGG